MKFMAVKGSSVIYSAGSAPRLWSPETQPESNAGWGSRIAQPLGCQEKASGSWVTPHNSMIDIFYTRPVLKSSLEPGPVLAWFYLYGSIK